MKEFDLERAKAGDPVIQRNGLPARIVCFDVKNDNYPLIVVRTEDIGEESFSSYTESGKLWLGDDKSHRDLFMAPQKITYWYNLYKVGGLASDYFDSKEEAKKNIISHELYLETRSIEIEKE
jgi:hypothetical protein